MDPYESWLCGGAIVSSTQILTSAACIVDIKNLYAIAGYRKYINGLDIDMDKCTSMMKQRVVKIRVPREHMAHLDEYKNSTQWMTLDVGVATVEKPYDFQDVAYRVYCSYIPSSIDINYNPELDQLIDTNVVALGWGRDKGALPTDVVDRNSETLREVSLKIKSKKICIDKFQGNGLTEMIQNNMICTYDKGLLDGEGFVIDEYEEMAYEKCYNTPSPSPNGDGNVERCMDDVKKREEGDVKGTLKSESKKVNVTYGGRTRRQGICQNDHGGPLVTWVGTKELLIGVAVNSLYDENFECIGPYLFTSTSAAGKVVRCLLANEEPRRSCLDDSDRYDIMEKLVTHTNNGPYQPLYKAHIDESTIAATEIHTETQSTVPTEAHYYDDSKKNVNEEEIDLKTDPESMTSIEVISI